MVSSRIYMSLLCLRLKKVLYTVSNLVISDSFPKSTQGLAGGVFNVIVQVRRRPIGLPMHYGLLANWGCFLGCEFCRPRHDFYYSIYSQCLETQLNLEFFQVDGRLSRQFLGMLRLHASGEYYQLHNTKGYRKDRPEERLGA
jgi:hypothetical protein